MVLEAHSADMCNHRQDLALVAASHPMATADLMVASVEVSEDL